MFAWFLILWTSCHHFGPDAVEEPLKKRDSSVAGVESWPLALKPKGDEPFRNGASRGTVLFISCSVVKQRTASGKELSAATDDLPAVGCMTSAALFRACTNRLTEMDILMSKPVVHLHGNRDTDRLEKQELSFLNNLHLCHPREMLFAFLSFGWKQV